MTTTPATAPHACDLTKTNGRPCTIPAVGWIDRPSDDGTKTLRWYYCKRHFNLQGISPQGTL